MDENIQVEKDLKDIEPRKEDTKPEAKSEISPERIERMKKAFRSTWLQDQLNSVNKGSNGKKQ